MKNILQKNNHNNKNIWKGLKQLISLKPRGNYIPIKIVKVNHEITNTRDICQAFNDYFSNIWQKLYLVQIQHHVVLWGSL